jgi:hypothetical protein
MRGRSIRVVEDIMNNTVARMLAAGALPIVELPAITQSRQPFEPYEIDMNLPTGQ